MQRRGDEWRIQHRAVVIDWTREFPLSAEKDSAMDAMGYGKEKPYETGLRKPDDISYRFLKPAQ
jgi:hypothetical protein